MLNRADKCVSPQPNCSNPTNGSSFFGAARSRVNPPPSFAWIGCPPITTSPWADATGRPHQAARHRAPALSCGDRYAFRAAFQRISSSRVSSVGAFLAMTPRRATIARRLRDSCRLWPATCPRSRRLRLASMPNVEARRSLGRSRRTTNGMRGRDERETGK